MHLDRWTPRLLTRPSPKPLQDPKQKAPALYDKEDKVTSQVFRHTQDGGDTGDKRRAYLHDKSILIQMADQMLLGLCFTRIIQHVSEDLVGKFGCFLCLSPESYGEEKRGVIKGDVR